MVPRCVSSFRLFCDSKNSEPSGEISRIPMTPIAARRAAVAPPLTVICHSLGCAGLFSALGELGIDGFHLDNLVTLGAPFRSDYPVGTAPIGNWFNIYAPNDLWQKLGGRIPFFGGRTNSNATNFSVRTLHGMFGAHSALHNDWITRLMWESLIGSTGSSAGSHGGQNPSPPTPPLKCPLCPL